jgi:hypothetical protein
VAEEASIAHSAFRQRLKKVGLRVFSTRFRFVYFSLQVRILSLISLFLFLFFVCFVLCAALLFSVAKRGREKEREGGVCGFPWGAVRLSSKGISPVNVFLQIDNLFSLLVLILG